MEFEWDPQKALTNKEKHGVDFADAIEVFGNPARLDVDATREQDKERRRKAMAYIGTRLIAVICTERNGIIRLISARRTNKPEDILYANRPPSA